MNVHLIRLNPYDPNLGLLVPIVARRITEYAKEHTQELDPVAVTRAVMVPLWSQDPFTLVLAMVNPEGTVVGHAVVGVNSDGISTWATVSQTQADGAVGDAVKRALDTAEKWVKDEVNPLIEIQGRRPISRVTLVTGRNEKAWERDLGFKLERRIVSKALGGTVLTGEEGSQEVRG